MTANTFVVNRNNVLVTKKIIINNFDAKAKFNKINQEPTLVRPYLQRLVSSAEILSTWQPKSMPKANNRLNKTL